MDTRLYKHDFRALPSVKGLRQRPSCRVSEFLVSPIADEALFGLINEASHRTNAGVIIRALLSLRNPRKRLSRANLQILRAFQPMMPLIDWVIVEAMDAQNAVIWRHNVIVRMVAGQRGVEETMRLLRIAPAEVEYYAMDDPRWGVSGEYTF